LRCEPFYGLWLDANFLTEVQIGTRCLLSLVREALRGSLTRDQALFLTLSTVPRRSRVVGDVMASQQALLFGSEVGSGEVV